MPGPGEYTSPVNLGSPSMVSGHTNSLPRLATTARRGSITANTTLLGPGPGAYQLPCEFGVLDDIPCSPTGSTRRGMTKNSSQPNLTSQ
jgi:hypothetical protein